MGLLGFFRRSNEDKIRLKIRKGFDDSVKDAIRHSDMNDSFFMGMIVQSAIGSFYQSMKQETTLALMCGQFGLDYDSLLEEECQRALKKYLK